MWRSPAASEYWFDLKCVTARDHETSETSLLRGPGHRSLVRSGSAGLWLVKAPALRYWGMMQELLWISTKWGSQSEIRFYFPSTFCTQNILCSRCRRRRPTDHQPTLAAYSSAQTHPLAELKRHLRRASILCIKRIIQSPLHQFV